MSKSERFLTVYSGVLTLVFAVVVLTGASEMRNAKFDEIDVQRINVREADGTLRMAISNRELFPGAIIKGKEYKHQRGSAGMIFYNDEGTETGGLIFDGRKDADGKVDSGMSFTFDRYEQDQQLQLLGMDKAGRHYAAMKVNDRPDRPMLEDIEELEKIKLMPKDAQIKLMQERKQRNYYGAERYYAGKTPDNQSVLTLSDARGKPRLTLTVTPAGEAKIQFLDAEGKVQRTLMPDSLAAK